jgi:hypothetical protein
LKHRINSFLPALRVHTWGGFGSQLFTAYLILKLQRDVPQRSILAVNHTSGVSRRTTEFDFESLGVASQQIEDFKGKEVPVTAFISDKGILGRLFKFLKVFTVRFLKGTKIIVEANGDTSFSSIKPWTLALRGHYTNISLENNLVKDLYALLINSQNHTKVNSSKVVIHYRLGDLLTLKEKSPVSPERIDTILSSIISKDVVPILLTDSSQDEFSKYVSQSSMLQKCIPVTLDPLHTLQLCIGAEVFVGTGAKISLWAAIFRQFLLQQTSYLPNELKWSAKNGLNINWY